MREAFSLAVAARRAPLQAIGQTLGLGSKYRNGKAAVVTSFVDGAGRGGLADEEGSGNDAFENRSASSIGRVRPLPMR